MQPASRIRERAASLTAAEVVWNGLLTALAIEAVTAVLRIGTGLSVQQDTAWVAQFTLGLRIHHGYIGLGLLLAAAVRRWPPGRRNLMCVLGIGLLVSDALHHFVVLWIYTGAPEFNFFYH